MRNLTRRERTVASECGLDVTTLNLTRKQRLLVARLEESLAASDSFIMSHETGNDFHCGYFYVSTDREGLSTYLAWDEYEPDFIVMLGIADQFLE